MASTARDALMFDSVNIAQYFKGFEVNRPLMPEIDLHTIDIPGMDGVMLSGRKLKPLYIDVVATLDAQSASSVATVRKNLTAILNKVAPKQLILPDDTTVFYNAILQGTTDLNRLREFPKVKLRFMVPDASAWSVAEKSTSLSSSTYKTVAVGGNAPTYPRFEVTRSTQNTPSFQRDTSDYFAENEHLNVGTMTSLAQGTSIVVDMEAETCFSGTTEYFPNSGNYWQLGPGDNSVVISAVSGTVYWRERWV